MIEIIDEKHTFLMIISQRLWEQLLCFPLIYFFYVNLCQESGYRCARLRSSTVVSSPIKSRIEMAFICFLYSISRLPGRSRRLRRHLDSSQMFYMHTSSEWLNPFKSLTLEKRLKYRRNCISSFYFMIIIINMKLARKPYRLLHQATMLYMR